MDVTEEVTATLRAEAHHPPCVMEAAGFCTEHSANARSIGYEEERSPTLRAGVVPAAIALENHPADSRVKISEDGKVQTLTSRCGTGGGNVPMVMDAVENSVESPVKEVENSPAVTLKIRSGCEGGGKGAIWQEEKSATLGCNNDQTLFVPKCYGVCSKASHSMMSDNPHSGFYEAETSRTLDRSGGDPTCNQGGICVVEPVAFNMACIRLFEGIKYVLPILHPNKKRLALIMCPEEDSASVEWARQKDANWVNKDITSLEFVENIFKLMNWNRECRYKVLGRVANSDQGLCMLFDLEEAIMFTPKPQEYTDPLTGEMKKKQIKFFPDVYKDRIGKSYNDYIAGHQMNLFEDFIGYQGSVVLDEPEQKTDTISVPIPQGEGSGNTPLPDLSEQPENVQRPGSEVVEKGMLT